MPPIPRKFHQILPPFADDQPTTARIFGDTIFIPYRFAEILDVAPYNLLYQCYDIKVDPTNRKILIQFKPVGFLKATRKPHRKDIAITAPAHIRFFKLQPGNYNVFLNPQERQLILDVLTPAPQHTTDTITKALQAKLKKLQSLERLLDFIQHAFLPDQHTLPPKPKLTNPKAKIPWPKHRHSWWKRHAPKRRDEPPPPPGWK